MADSANYWLHQECSRLLRIQKLNFKANWIIRGLLLVEMMRPKLPALRTCPVEGSMLPPEAKRALRLLIGLAKFGLLNRLSVLLINQIPLDASTATCTGADPCHACKNCTYCRHCAKEGGTCGVCKGALRDHRNARNGMNLVPLAVKSVLHVPSNYANVRTNRRQVDVICVALTRCFCIHLSDWKPANYFKY